MFLPVWSSCQARSFSSFTERSTFSFTIPLYKYKYVWKMIYQPCLIKSLKQVSVKSIYEACNVLKLFKNYEKFSDDIIFLVNFKTIQ